MTREEFYKLTDILNSEVLGNFMHGGEADELIAMFEEAIEHSNILKQEELVSKDYRERYKRIAQSEAFKRTHEGRSVGEIMHVEGECVHTCESCNEKDIAVAGKTERISDKDILNELHDQEIWWMNSIDALSKKLESEKGELARVRRLISILEDKI